MKDLLEDAVLSLASWSFSMTRLLSCVLAIGVLMVTSMSVAGGDKKRPGKVSDGTWVVVGMEQNGMKLHADDLEKLSMKLTIKGNDYIVAMADKVIDKGTSAVDTTKRPNTLNIKSEFGPNKGKTILGI